MIEVFIKKPIHGNFVFIRDKYLNKAESACEKLRIRTPKGERICTPAEWKRNAKYMEKVFLRPDEPMKLWGNYVFDLNPNQRRLL